VLGLASVLRLKRTGLARFSVPGYLVVSNTPKVALSKAEMAGQQVFAAAIGRRNDWEFGAKG
jgi:hypothetical protein